MLNKDGDPTPETTQRIRPGLSAFGKLSSKCLKSEAFNQRIMVCRERYRNWKQCRRENVVGRNEQEQKENKIDKRSDGCNMAQKRWRWGFTWSEILTTDGQISQ